MVPRYGNGLSRDEWVSLFRWVIKTHLPSNPTTPGQLLPTSHIRATVMFCPEAERWLRLIGSAPDDSVNFNPVFDATPPVSPTKNMKSMSKFRATSNLGSSPAGSEEQKPTPSAEERKIDNMLDNMLNEDSNDTTDDTLDALEEDATIRSTMTRCKGPKISGFEKFYTAL